VRRAHAPARRAAHPSRGARHRHRYPLPGAYPPSASMAADVRRNARATTRRAGGARDPLAARSRGPDRRGGRAGGGRRVELLPEMNGDGPAPALSLVVPVYDEEENVAPVHAELGRIAATLGRPYEIVFVNDGSRDGTLARLERLAAADPRVRIVD